MPVASGITNITVSKNADGSHQVSWTDSKGGSHSMAVDLNSDLIGLYYIIAKAVNTGALT